jgi:hypothetical protein
VAFTFNGSALGQCTAAANGACSASQTVPTLPDSTYTVAATGQTSALSASASFAVTPSLTLSPTTGVPGASVSASVAGFAASEIVILSFAGTSFGQCTTAATGACSATVTVPTASDGTYPVQATGQTSSLTASANFTVINPVVVTNPGSQANVSGTAISPLALTATDPNPHATITWSASGLPTGLSISSSTGVITGTPTTAGNYSVTARASDPARPSGSATFSWTIYNTIKIPSPGPRTSQINLAITPLQLHAYDTSSTATITWLATGLPPGLTLNASTGAISGTPTNVGEYTVKVTATDDASYVGTLSFDWKVFLPKVTVVRPAGQISRSGTAIVPLHLKATDTSTNSTINNWTATGLPAGLAIDSSTGVISGTPTTAGTHLVTVTATDGDGYHGSASFYWKVVNLVTVTNPGSQTSPHGTAISPLHLTATDSSAFATIIFWTATGLPTGLRITSTTGTISGTPTVAGTFTVTVTAKDSAASVGRTTFTWTIS